MSANADILNNMKRWREYPDQMVRELFNVEPDPWQVDVLRAFPHRQRIALQSSKGVGKSTILAWVAWNFLLCHPDAKIAATSITESNLSDGLWAEMSKWQAKSPLLKQAFVWNKTRIFCRDAPENWFMSARTWPKSADTSQQADTLAGLHADYMMFILDEVGGIPDGVMAAAEAGLSSGIKTRIVMAGNPTHLEGPLYRAATSERHLWYITEITSDPDNPKRSPRVSVQWAREQIEKYGKDNPWVLVNVYGQFPPSSLNTLLGVEEVTSAMKKNIKPDDYNFSQKRLGVDVARFGGDMSVIFPRQGLLAFPPMEMRNATTTEIAARVMIVKKELNSEMEFVDGTGGFGSGVVDCLSASGISAQEIHFSSKPNDPRYLNRRAEMWWEMAQWVKRGGVLPNIPELVRELTVPTYTFKNGKIQIEDKAQVKERLGYSPDRADALALTFALPDMPKSDAFTIENIRDTFQGRGKLKSEWDPFNN